MLLIVILSLSILTFGIDKVKADSNLILSGAEKDISFLSTYMNPLMEVLSQIDDYYSSIIYNHYDNKSYDSFTVTLRKPGYTNLTNYANNANSFQYPWDEHSSSNINDNTVGFRVDTKTIGYGNNLNSSYYTNLENYVSLFVSFFQDYLDTGVFHPNILTSQGHYVTPANYHVSYTTHFFTSFIPLFSTENVTFTPSDPSYRYTYNGEILPLSFNYPFHFYRNNFNTDMKNYDNSYWKYSLDYSDFIVSVYDPEKPEDSNYPIDIFMLGEHYDDTRIMIYDVQTNQFVAEFTEYNLDYEFDDRFYGFSHELKEHEVLRIVTTSSEVRDYYITNMYSQDKIHISPVMNGESSYLNASGETETTSGMIDPPEKGMISSVVEYTDYGSIDSIFDKIVQAFNDSQDTVVLFFKVPRDFFNSLNPTIKTYSIALFSLYMAYICVVLVRRR